LTEEQPERPENQDPAPDEGEKGGAL